MNLAEFIEKHKSQPQLNHVLDYLKSNGFSEKSINFSFEQALQKAQAWTRQLNDKNRLLEEAGKVQEVMSFPDGFKIVRLLNQTAKNWEGLHMGHCVASYTSHRGIYSLRDSNNMPHCTIEKSGREIEQIEGKANKAVIPKYVPYITEFLKTKKVNVEFDIITEKLGYIWVRPENEEFTDREGFDEEIDFLYDPSDRRLEIPLKVCQEYFEGVEILTMKREKYVNTRNSWKIKEGVKLKFDIYLLNYLCRTGQCNEAVTQLLRHPRAKLYTRRLIIPILYGGNLSLFKKIFSRLKRQSKSSGTKDFTSCSGRVVAIACKKGSSEILEYLIEQGCVQRRHVQYLTEFSLSNDNEEGVLTLLKHFKKDITFNDNFSSAIYCSKGFFRKILPNFNNNLKAALISECLAENLDGMLEILLADESITIPENVELESQIIYNLNVYSDMEKYVPQILSKFSKRNRRFSGMGVRTILEAKLEEWISGEYHEKVAELLIDFLGTEKSKGIITNMYYSPHIAWSVRQYLQKEFAKHIEVRS